MDLSLDDWRAIEETLYLNQEPSLVESLRAAAAEPPSEETPLQNLEW